MITELFGTAQHSQYWSRELAKKGYSVQFLTRQFTEDIGVKEKMVGRIRLVKLVGGMDRSGILIFPKRQFRKTEIAKLVEWLNELKAYGAQGISRGETGLGVGQDSV